MQRRVYWFCASGHDFETPSRFRARWHEIGTWIRSRGHEGHVMLRVEEVIT